MQPHQLRSRNGWHISISALQIFLERVGILALNAGAVGTASNSPPAISQYCLLFFSQNWYTTVGRMGQGLDWCVLTLDLGYVTTFLRVHVTEWMQRVQSDLFKLTELFVDDLQWTSYNDHFIAWCDEIISGFLFCPCDN